MEIQICNMTQPHTFAIQGAMNASAQIAENDPAPERLRELREARNLTQAQLGDLAGLSGNAVGHYERRERRLKSEEIGKLAAALQVDASELFGKRPAPTVPLTTTIAAHESDVHPSHFHAPNKPLDRVQVRRLENPDDYFAAEILDDSADYMDYPPQTVLIVQRLDALTGPLQIGQQVVAQRFLTTRGADDSFETLAGIIDRSVTGDIVVIVRSSNKRLPNTIMIQATPRRHNGLDERMRSFSPEKRDIDYQPDDADEAEILGCIKFVQKPVF